MKKLAAIIIALCTLTACETDNGHQGRYVFADYNDCIVDGRIVDNMIFLGESVVETIAGPDTGAVYVDDAAYFELAPNYTTTVNLYMHETRFAPTMPPLEMVVPNIPYIGRGNAAAISAAIIIPQVGGTPFQRYTITELSGNIDGIHFTASFVCAGMFRVTYEGYLVYYEEHYYPYSHRQ